MRQACLVTVLLATAFAGCTGEPHPPSAADAQPAPAAALDLSQAAFSGCTYTEFEERYPGNTAPGAAPAGWEPTARPLSSLRLQVWDCQDVLLAGEHWGPTRLLAEFGPSNGYHDGCRAADEAFVFGLVHAVWTDRADLAAAVKQRLGRDMLVGTFEGGVTRDGDVVTADWTWWTGYFEPSHVVVRHPMTQHLGTGGYGWVQWVWFNATSVLTLDVNYGESTNDLLFTGTAQAEMQAPTLMSQDGLAQGEAVLASAVPALDGAGPVTRYRDLYCEDPIRDAPAATA